MTNEDFPDLINSVEVVLNRSFQGARLSVLFQAVQTRISELQQPAAQEAEFDENSLELGILKELLAELAGRGPAHAASLQVH